MSNPLVKGDKLKTSPLFPMLEETSLIAEIQESSKGFVSMNLMLGTVHVGTMEIKSIPGGYERKLV